MEGAKGIDHLNGLGIQHRDIKPQNLLIAGGGVKVADFGLAKVLEQSVASASGAMTPAYAAPEFFKGEATRSSDQYSLAISYCQLRGEPIAVPGQYRPTPGRSPYAPAGSEYAAGGRASGGGPRPFQGTARSLALLPRFRQGPEGTRSVAVGGVRGSEYTWQDTAPLTLMVPPLENDSPTPP